MNGLLGLPGGLSRPGLFSRLVNRPLLTTPENAFGWLTALAERSQIVPILAGASVVPRRYRADHAAGEEWGGGSEDAQRAPYAVVQGVAVIKAYGSSVNKGAMPFCGMFGYDWLSETVRAAALDRSVKGILLDIDSPGGEVAGCFDCADSLRAVAREKPLWASLSETALSAGYALASQAGRVFVPRTGAVGSIGVVAMHVDQSAMMEGEGLAVTLIHAGARKVDGNPYQPLPDGVRAEYQASCERTRLLFAQTVARGRRLKVPKILATEAGVFEGADGVREGLADAVASPSEALQEFIDHLHSSKARTSAPNPKGYAVMANRQLTRRQAAARRRAANDLLPDEEAEDLPPEDCAEGEDDDPSAEDPADQQQARRARGRRARSHRAEVPIDDEAEDLPPEDDAEGEDDDPSAEDPADQQQARRARGRRARSRRAEMPIDEGAEDQQPDDDPYAENPDPDEEIDETGEEVPLTPAARKAYFQGRRAENRRWSATMSNSVAVGREDAAMALLGSSRMSARAVVRTLLRMPRAGGLSAQMARVSNLRGVGGRGDKSAASSILGAYAKATGYKPK